jgi:hypothetical protein
MQLTTRCKTVGLTFLRKGQERTLCVQKACIYQVEAAPELSEPKIARGSNTALAKASRVARIAPDVRRFCRLSILSARLNDPI